MALGVPLPPEPDITMRGTWIDAAICYCNHFQVGKDNVDLMKTENARATEDAFIKSNFSSLTEGIRCLQEKGAMLEDLLSGGEKKTANDLKKVSGAMTASVV
jgi:hypothetical protein